MGDHHDHDDHNHMHETSDAESRTRALESLLIEKGVLETEEIDQIVSAYEHDIGPLNGAKVVSRAWVDPEYKEWLLEDATEAIGDLCFEGSPGPEMKVVENTPTVHNIIVCTLCSCYPWSVLGLPPTWYKSPEYRSKIVKRPRQTLQEDFGLELDDSIEVRVQDSNSELRYMVLPQRPSGTDDMNEAELAEIVTRDVMTGVSRLIETHE
jgi:nitrile hydratase